MFDKHTATPINQVIRDFIHQGFRDFQSFNNVPYPLVLRQSLYRPMVLVITQFVMTTILSAVLAVIAIFMLDMNLWGMGFFILLGLITIFRPKVKNLFHTLYIYSDHLVWQQGFIFKKTHHIAFDDIYNIHVGSFSIVVPRIVGAERINLDALCISYTSLDDNYPKKSPCHTLFIPLYRSDKQKGQAELQNIVEWLALYKQFTEYKQSKNNNPTYHDMTDNNILYHLFSHLNSGSLVSKDYANLVHSYLVDNLAKYPPDDYPIVFYPPYRNIYNIIIVIIVSMLILAIALYYIPDNLTLWICALILYYFSVKGIYKSYWSIHHLSHIMIYPDCVEIISGYFNKQTHKVAIKDYEFYLEQIGEYAVTNTHINPKRTYKVELREKDRRYSSYKEPEHIYVSLSVPEKDYLLALFTLLQGQNKVNLSPVDEFC